LTSGLQEKAINGIALLKKLKDIAKEQLIILPGSGINPTNVRVFKSNGFKEIHTSASKIIANLNSTEQTISDVTTITEILNILKNT
jgi:copper homeostasis protein